MKACGCKYPLHPCSSACVYWPLDTPAALKGDWLELMTLLWSVGGGVAPG